MLCENLYKFCSNKDRSTGMWAPEIQKLQAKSDLLVCGLHCACWVYYDQRLCLKNVQLFICRLITWKKSLMCLF